MTPDQKGEYDAPLYGDSDQELPIGGVVLLIVYLVSFVLGVLVGGLL